MANLPARSSVFISSWGFNWFEVFTAEVSGSRIGSRQRVPCNPWRHISNSHPWYHFTQSCSQSLQKVVFQFFAHFFQNDTNIFSIKISVDFTNFTNVLKLEHWAVTKSNLPQTPNSSVVKPSTLRVGVYLQPAAAQCTGKVSSRTAKPWQLIHHKSVLGKIKLFFKLWVILILQTKSALWSAFKFKVGIMLLTDFDASLKSVFFLFNVKILESHFIWSNVQISTVLLIGTPKVSVQIITSKATMVSTNFLKVLNHTTLLIQWELSRSVTRASIEIESMFH